ncbi:MAG: 4Fe-4S binding protein [bacterium]|nr:4Fe-4S binding protein [bacterium]
MRRRIIRIDEERCNGCGLCVPNCPEGAIRIIDGKARMVSDIFCDGLGACLGHCPEGAIEIEEREAESYDERKVMENVVRGGTDVIDAHLAHLREHGETEYLGEAERFLAERGIAVPAAEAPCGGAPAGCPGARVMSFGPCAGETAGGPPRASRLRQWPIQLRLVPPEAPFLAGADLLLAADCVPFAHAGFHEELLAGKALLVGCPKFDDAAACVERLTAVFARSGVRSVTVARMEVPCCYGLVRIAREAIAASGREIPLEEVEIGVEGKRK